MVVASGDTINLTADLRFVFGNSVGCSSQILVPSGASDKTFDYGARGYAQPYNVNSDTTTTIMGISLFKGLPNALGSYYVTNDIVDILDNSGNVVYQQILTEDAISNIDINTGGCPFFEVYFDSIVSVVGDYYMFYSFSEENTQPSICVPLFAQYCFPLAYFIKYNSA